jgi:hypothetical protein
MNSSSASSSGAGGDTPGADGGGGNVTSGSLEEQLAAVLREKAELQLMRKANSSKGKAGSVKDR